MPPSEPSPAAVEAFIARWDGKGQAERANCQPFLSELCDLLGLPRPDPAEGGAGDYRFERSVTRQEQDGSTSTRRIDLYRRARFVLEAKQGAATKRQPSLFALHDEAAFRANVCNTPGWPPFLIVCDVGFCLDLYAGFSGTGKHYAQFPDRTDFRIFLPDLRRAEVRERLRQVWLDPLSLDPARRRAEVTREIAALFAKLVRALEGPRDRPRHARQHVATFLMRCMFAQSVGLLPTATSFSDLLRDCEGNLPGFVPLLGELWRAMDTGGLADG